MAATIKVLASTDPNNPRRMIRFSAAEDWFPGFDASALAEAILSGIGDATTKGIELCNQTVHAKLADGVNAIKAFDPTTGELVPMTIRLTLRVERDPANVTEATRIAAKLDETEGRKALKEVKEEKARDREDKRVQANVAAIVAAQGGQQAAGVITAKDLLGLVLQQQPKRLSE